MNPQQKKCCDFITANIWVRILMEVVGYTIYRVSTPRVYRNKKLPVTVLIWCRERDAISLHREAESPQIIHGVHLKEHVADVTNLLYVSHAMCSLEVVHVEPAVETSREQPAMWTLRLQDALRFIIHCIARDIPAERTEYEEDTGGHETINVFSALPMLLSNPTQYNSKGGRPLAFCTRYNGHHATTYVHATEDGSKWLSVDEETIMSRGAISSILDVYNGIYMPDCKSLLLRIFTKQVAAMIDDKYTKTENLKGLLAELPDDVFHSACAATPFCRVDESPDNDDNQTRLTLCLASKPSDDCIQMKLTLHRFVKANISRSLNACIESVLFEKV
jgi:hypothetical protein